MNNLFLIPALFTQFILPLYLHANLTFSLHLREADPAAQSNKVEVELTLYNHFAQEVRDVRVWVFLFDANDQLIGERVRWLGGDAEDGTQSTEDGTQKAVSRNSGSAARSGSRSGLLSVSSSQSDSPRKDGATASDDEGVEAAAETDGDYDADSNSDIDTDRDNDSVADQGKADGFLLDQESERKFVLVIDTKAPPATAKVLFTRIILEDGTLANPQTSVKEKE
jgi:hypothetical protein